MALCSRRSIETQKRGRRKVVDSSDFSDPSGNDPEYELSIDPTRALQQQSDDMAHEDVIVDGHRLSGDELADFQMEFVRKTDKL